MDKLFSEITADFFQLIELKTGSALNRPPAEHAPVAEEPRPHKAEPSGSLSSELEELSAQVEFLRQEVFRRVSGEVFQGAQDRTAEHVRALWEHLISQQAEKAPQSCRTALSNGSIAFLKRNYRNPSGVITAVVSSCICLAGRLPTEAEFDFLFVEAVRQDLGACQIAARVKELTASSHPLPFDFQLKRTLSFILGLLGIRIFRFSRPTIMRDVVINERREVRPTPDYDMDQQLEALIIATIISKKQMRVAEPEGAPFRFKNARTGIDWITRLLPRGFRHRVEARRLLEAGFDPEWYLQAYPDVAALRQDPVIHYIRHGYAEGRRINGLSESS